MEAVETSLSQPTAAPQAVAAPQTPPPFAKGSSNPKLTAEEQAEAHSYQLQLTAAKTAFADLSMQCEQVRRIATEASSRLATAHDEILKLQESYSLRLKQIALSRGLDPDNVKLILDMSTMELRSL
jgi:hypothetical protein